MIREPRKRPEGTGTPCPAGKGCCAQWMFFPSLNIRTCPWGSRDVGRGGAYFGRAIWLSWANDGGWGMAGLCKGPQRVGEAREGLR